MNGRVHRDLPSRAEHIGSLLRPRSLKNAFGAFRRGEISAELLNEVVDASIIDAIMLQENCGLNTITDGEFRRGSWFLGFVDSVLGLTTQPSMFGFSSEESAWQCPYAEGAIVRSPDGITIKEYDFLCARTSGTPKVTMPAPSAMHFWRGEKAMDRGIYPDLDKFFEDLTAVYRAEISELAKLGCIYLQFDEVPIAMLCDPKIQEAVSARGEDPMALLERYITITNNVLDGRPPNMTVGMHLCRGNYKGRWMAEGGYEPIAERLFCSLEVDAYFMEYDTPRAGDFGPLCYMPNDKIVVLGLISTKSPQLERKDEIKRRIDEAATIVPLDRLAISPQCGFSSGGGGGQVVTVDDTRRKLELVLEVARDVWD